MNSSAAAAGYLLRQSSSSSHHFLDLFSSPPQSSDAAASDEFNESEVFWTGDFAISSNCQFRSGRGSSSGNSGILAALTDDLDGDRKQRIGIGKVLNREKSISAAISSSSPRSIPRPLQNIRECSQSAPSSCRKFQKSAPINVPAMRKERNGEIVATEEEEEEEMLPPHEIVARGSGVTPKTTFSVLEGVGRTLKGRDLRRVRNAVWHKTGFLH